jgi:predicted site-specific integrase-resolvase
VNWKTTGQIANDFGVTPQTIRRWISNGEFEHVQRSRGGHFRIGTTPDDEQRFGYARVSSRKQRSSLDQQRVQIQEAYPETEVIADIGSGFNFKRKGFVTLLERALSGIAIHVVVSNRDRLSRVGFEFVRAIFERSGGSITALNQTSEESDQFSTELLVGFITSFCNSYYGRRSAKIKRSKSKDKALSNGPAQVV